MDEKVEREGVVYDVDRRARIAKVIGISGTTMPELVGTVQIDSTKCIVKSLGPRCFFDTTSRDIHVPDSIEIIEEGAFAKVRASRVLFSEISRLTEISAEAFAGSHIVSISIPKTVTVIRERAFEGCLHLAEVNLPKEINLKYFSPGVFHSSGINRLDVPASVIAIQARAFAGCNALSQVTFRSDGILEEIGESAFHDPKGNRKLTSISIPKSVRVIGVNAFRKCAALRKVSFGSASLLKEMCDGAFLCCSLKEIFIPQAVERLGDWCLAIASLKKVTFERHSSLKSIGKHCFHTSLLSTIEIPSSVVSIGDGAFKFCGQLTTVKFAGPCSLKEIGVGAFLETGLTKFVLPSSVEKVGHWAFCHCPALETLKIPRDSALSDCGLPICSKTFITYEMARLKGQRQELWDVDVEM